jgi:hypothetical protein
MGRARLEARRRVLGLNDVATLNSIDLLALVLLEQGKVEQAEEMYRWALVCYEKPFGVDHSSSLTSVENLSAVLQLQGEYVWPCQRNLRGSASIDRSQFSQPVLDRRLGR